MTDSLSTCMAVCVIELNVVNRKDPFATA